MMIYILWMFAFIGAIISTDACSVVECDDAQTETAMLNCYDGRKAMNTFLAANLSNIEVGQTIGTIKPLKVPPVCKDDHCCVDHDCSFLTTKVGLPLEGKMAFTRTSVSTCLGVTIGAKLKGNVDNPLINVIIDIIMKVISKIPLAATITNILEALGDNFIPLKSQIETAFGSNSMDIILKGTASHTEFPLDGKCVLKVVIDDAVGQVMQIQIRHLTPRVLLACVMNIIVVNDTTTIPVDSTDNMCCSFMFLIRVEAKLNCADGNPKCPADSNLNCGQPTCSTTTTSAGTGSAPGVSADVETTYKK